MKGLERLSVIRKISQEKPDWKHSDLFRILRKEDIWIAAYKNLKGNKGARTAGVSNDNFNEIGLSRLRKVQMSVLVESYQFQPVNPKWISKTNKKFHSLNLSTLNDKLVQEVIRMILQAIYEPNFDNRSFGFRKGMEVHNALEYVERQFRWVDWIIKVERKNAYLTIEYKKLCEILSQRIEDVRFLNLIRKSFKRELYPYSSFRYSKLGVPQRSIVLPILVNIYFNELDKRVSQIQKEVYGEKSSKCHQKDKRLEYRILKQSKLISTAKKSSKQHNQFVRELKYLIQQRNNLPKLSNRGIQIHYTRYANDWIIGIKGPYRLAKEVKEEVNSFLRDQLNQELNIVQTKIINIRAGKVCFLGYDIFLPRNLKLVKYKKINGKQPIHKSTLMLRFQIPIDQITKRLYENGYITYTNNKIRPISKKSYTPLEDAVIVNHFRMVWLGIFNFYSGCTNRSQLQYIHYLLHMSCAMTLAHRHRSSSKKIFKKHGKRLEILDNKNNNPKIIAAFPYHISWKVSDRKWLLGKSFQDPFII